MDLAKFGLVTLVVSMLVELLKRKAPKLWAKIDLFAVLLIGIAVVFLVSLTTWAHSQVFMGVALDNMRIADKVVAGIIVAAGAWGFSQIVQQAIPSIGENPVLSPKALEAKGIAKQGVGPVPPV